MNQNVLKHLLRKNAPPFLNKISAFTLSLLLLFANFANAQQNITFKGKVTDGAGEPLIGASVSIEGTTFGTMVDVDGNYSLEASLPQGLHKLVCTMVGFSKQTENVTISNQSEIKQDFKLDSDALGLDEVVVVGYGQESKTLQSSSVASIKASDISNIPTSQLSTSLAGRLAGVNIVQNSGFVGGSADIFVRGSATAALYVIDNVVSDKAQFDALSPTEVESISVLKDAAAAAIYGARASGGVVLIKTKSGAASGKVRVNYSNIFTGFQLTQPLQDWTAYQELLHNNQVAYNNNRIAENPNPNFQPPHNQEALDYAKTLNYEDINDVLWRSPSSQQHNLDVSGGTEKVRYFFSTSYNKNKGSYDNTNFDKYGLRAKVDAQISKNFKIGSNVNYNRRDTDRFYWPYDRDGGEGFTVADFYRPTFNLSRLFPLYSLEDGTPVNHDAPGAIATIKNWHFHPGQIVNSKNYRNILYNTFNAILDAELKIPQVEGLSLKFLGNYRQDNYLKKDFIGEFNEAYIVQVAGDTGADLLKTRPLILDDAHRALDKYSRSNTGIDESFGLAERYQLNGFINYDRNFNKHYISSFLGVEQYQYSLKYVTGTASDVLSVDNDQIIGTNSSTDRRYFDGGENNQTRLSYFGNLKYAYDAKYILGASFRYDGSFIFPKGKRFGFFPSFSAGWVASKERFFEPLKNVVSTFKLRGSYGTTGYDGIDGTETKIAPFQYQFNYVPAGSYTFENNTQQALLPTNTIPNPNITWATNRTVNIGFDAGLLNDKMIIAFDYFTTKRTGLLVSRVAATPGTFGSRLPDTNIGEQRVRGFDFSLIYQGKVNPDLNYSIGLNAGYSRDEYVKWPQAENIPEYQRSIGLPTEGVVRGYISKGIIRDQAVIDALPEGYTQNGLKLQLGNVLIEDINGDNYSPGPDGIVDENDQTIISKNAVPRFNFGVPLNVNWKDFSLALFFQGVGPYDKFVSTINTKAQGGVFQYNRPYFQLWTDAYSQEYNPDGKYPAVMNKWTNPTSSGSATTFWKRNGAYMRLKNINVSYSIPQKILEPIGISRVQLNFNATNLFTITSFKEYDPEQSSLDSYPIFRSMSLGLNVTF